MNQKIKDRIAKIMELISRGATEGEKEAARKSLERIMKAHNIDESQLTSVLFKEYDFKVTKGMTEWLFSCIIWTFVPGAERSGLRVSNSIIKFSLTYEEYITVHCAYEYFRRHMKMQYRKTVVPILKRYRKAVNKRKAKERLTSLFISKYLIKSQLVPDMFIAKVDLSEMSQKEIEMRIKMESVEGGKYNKQVSNTKLLTQ